MKIIFISDTHSKEKHFTDVVNGMYDGNLDTILVHCGDFTFKGWERELRKFNKWLGVLDIPNDQIYYCAGNHELSLNSSDRDWYESLLTNGTYLKDESVIINGYSFYFSPHQPYFFNWAFNYHEDRADIIWSNIPTDTDVLVTHGPPLNILDECDGGHVGCKALRNHIFNRVKPIIHAFGHIHEGYGQQEVDGIQFINASVLNGAYEPVNQPIIIEL
jgi:Icc-related predicted phosphoesterase